jgi:TonB-dependent starch-binding outer membrane protein SusC
MALPVVLQLQKLIEMRPILICIAMLFFSSVAWAQREISGQVVDDEHKAPIQGASIVVKNSRIGTSSDVDGNFRLTVPATARTLVITISGFDSREIDLSAGRSEYSISLGKNVQALNEVVIAVAYGEQERKKLTGSVGKVTAKQIENIPLASVDQILQGKVAGLQSVATTGQPGAAQQIRIRGIGSITASSAPLFVIDGLPVTTGDASNLTNSSNLLAGINPNDIESISVLKDASAASIYGSRAANGVIIINTKKGKAGKTKIRLDTEAGYNDIAYKPTMGKPLNREEVYDLFSEGLVNAGFPASAVPGIMEDFFGYNTDANYEWLDEVTRKGQQQQINLSASGGDARTQFFLSGGFFKQQSPAYGADLKRYSGNINIRHQLSKKFNVGLNLNVSTFRQMGESESANFRNPILAAMGLLPTAEAYNPDGTPNFDPAVFGQIYNPIALREYDNQTNQTTKLLGSTFIEYRLLNNLKLTSRFGMDYNTIEENLYQNPYFGDAQADGGLTANTYNRLANWTWTNLADYTFRAVEDKLDGSVTIGYEAQRSKQYIQTGTGIVVPKNRALVYPQAAVPTTASLTGSDFAFTSLLSRAQVNYLGKYSLSGSLRRDGSSRFGVNNRYGTFWSVGAAWNVDEENFMMNSKIISALKIRASYGVNGNAGIGNYDWRSIFNFTTTYNGMPGSFQNSIGNNNLTWEQNKPFDIGFELGVLNNRILVEADYYTRKTDQLLLNEPLSNTSGFLTYSNNVGAMENKGFEITINATPIKTKDITWTISLNGAWNKNKVTRLREDATEILFNPGILRVGEDVQAYFIRQFAGADIQTGDPLWYIDESKTGTTSDFSEANRVLFGSASPKGFGGFSTSFTWKFITLDAQLNYQYGNKIYNQWDFIFISDGAFLGINHNRKALERWQNPGDITDVPRFEYSNPTSSNEVSTRYLYKGDFLRLRNLSVGFQLPARLAQKASLTSARLYVRGTNIWTKTFDKNITMDPEQPINGLSDLQFFNPKSYTIGLSIEL